MIKFFEENLIRKLETERKNQIENDKLDEFTRECERLVRPEFYIQMREDYSFVVRHKDTGYFYAVPRFWSKRLTSSEDLSELILKAETEIYTKLAEDKNDSMA